MISNFDLLSCRRDNETLIAWVVEVELFGGNFMRSMLLLGALLFIPLAAVAQVSEATYPKVDTFLGEKLGVTEIEDAIALVASLSAKIRAEYIAGGARRDAHPKAHGCVKAEVQFDDALPERLAHGVFKSNARYAAVIRFSNGSPDAAGDDKKGDTRGMAIKLFGVGGEKLLSDPGAGNVHDFILISSPSFFVNDAHGYTDFFERVNSGELSRLFKIPFILGWQGTKNAYNMLSQTIANPLHSTYFSVTPYQLGLGDDRHPVKYSARPCSAISEDVPEDAGKNFLRHAMQDSLNKGAACMQFMVQSPTTKMSVEDVITPWDEAQAPFVRVAKITIPAQVFDTAKQNEACENLSYNPWRALPAHRPLGTINRMRRVVYEAISELRHGMNGAE